MQDVVNLLSQPWHWSVSGLGIVLVMFLLMRAGGRFGVSSNLRTICAIAGAGRHSSYFDYQWRDHIWNLVFITGAIGGGFIGSTVLASPDPVEIAPATADYLATIHVAEPTAASPWGGFVPGELFGTWNNVGVLVLLSLGGFLVGFGSRYAGGCTSGHAISGLSNFQLASLIAVIGFFTGGLLMVWLIMPYVLPLFI